MSDFKLPEEFVSEVINDLKVLGVDDMDMPNILRSVANRIEEEGEESEEGFRDYRKNPYYPTLPWPINKALCDPYSYIAVLRNGWVIRFGSVEIESYDAPPEFITLIDVEVDECLTPGFKLESWHVGRGFVVRASDIIACSDFES